MEKYNWNSDLNGVNRLDYGPPNTFHADARLPVSLIVR